MNDLLQILDKYKIAFVFLIIFFLVLLVVFKMIKKNKNDSNQDMLKKAIDDSKKVSIDMSNIIISINNSRDLYKKLCVKYHPDKFIDENIKKIANDLIAEINSNKTDYKKLLVIENKAEKLLKQH